MFNANSVPSSINIIKLKKDHNPTKKLIIEKPMFSLDFELLIIDNSEHVQQMIVAINPKFATFLNKKRQQIIIFPTVKKFFDV